MSALRCRGYQIDERVALSWLPDSLQAVQLDDGTTAYFAGSLFSEASSLEGSAPHGSPGEAAAYALGESDISQVRWEASAGSPRVAVGGFRSELAEPEFPISAFLRHFYKDSWIDLVTVPPTWQN